MEIAIFKSGTHTDSSGRTAEFTPEQLTAMAEKNNARFTANGYVVPAIISEEGHPTTNLPAYGWFTTFTVKPDADGTSVLYGELQEPMLPAFSNVLANKTYKNRSVAFNKDGFITHVAFLGAMPPAIKDLPEVNMAMSAYLASEYAAFTEMGAPTDAAQTGRSSSYSIAIHVPGAKPGADMKDEHYADPVNYKFPITKDSVGASLAAWSKDTSQANYTDAEKQVVAARMVKSARAYGISLTPYTWAYTVPDSGISEQQAASAKYGIQIKQVKASSLPESTQQTYQKPVAFASLTDEQFGDPVNYRFPIQSPAFVLSSLKEFGSWETKDAYSEVERQVIFARLYDAALAQGLDTKELGWSYSAKLEKGKRSITFNFSAGHHISVPTESLSKKQLLDVVSKLSPGSTPAANAAAGTVGASQHVGNQSSTNQGTSMNEDQLKAMFEELLTWCSDTLGEEVATQISAKKDELLQKYLQQAAAANPDAAGDGTTPPAGGTTATDPKYAEMQKEIEELKKKNREAEYSQFAENAIKEGKLLPAQKAVVLQFMESVHDDNTSFSFTEGGKTKNAPAIEAFKSFIGSIQQIAMGEHATSSASSGNTPANTEFSFSEFDDIDEERLVLHKQAQKLVDDSASSANPMKYTEAVAKIQRGGKA